MSVAIGNVGEWLTLRNLNAHGLVATLGKRGKDSDIVCKDVQIEVKTARRGKDKKWRFTLYKKGSQDHRKSHIVLLCALLRSGVEVWFAIPTQAIKHKHHAVITSNPLTYGGRLAQYRLSSFSDLLALIEQQARG